MFICELFSVISLIIQLCCLTRMDYMSISLKENISFYSFFRLTDNLPCSTQITAENGVKQYEHGYRLGFVREDKVSIFI